MKVYAIVQQKIIRIKRRRAHWEIAFPINRTKEHMGHKHRPCGLSSHPHQGGKGQQQTRRRTADETEANAPTLFLREQTGISFPTRIINQEFSMFQSEP